MSITTLAGYQSSVRQTVRALKSGIGTQIITSAWTSTWTAGGAPGAGSNSIGNTANGTVPTSATTGAMPINTFSGTGYITGLEFAQDTQAVRVMLFDRLFVAGSYAINTATTLTAQPSFTSRIPNGNYSNVQLWCEGATNGSATRQVTITYTDQSGNTGHTTSTVTLNALGNVSNGMQQIPLASGDAGVSVIESITFGNVGTGTTNVMLIRPLWYGFITTVSAPNIYYFDTIGMPVVYSDSCLCVAMNGTGGASSTTPGFDMNIEIASA